MTLIFSATAVTKFQGRVTVTGVRKLRFSPKIAVYLGNGTRWTHGYQLLLLLLLL